MAMARKHKSRSPEGEEVDRRTGSQTERRRRRRDRRSASEGVRKRERTMLLVGIVAVIMIIGMSAVAYRYLVPDTSKASPEVVVIDAVGTKGDPSVDTITSIKISIKNGGHGSFDMRDLRVSWRGPGVDTDLFFNVADVDKADKDNFGTGGVGFPSDGWDPSSGNYRVKGGTVAWVIVNLTSDGGIGDLLGPGKTFTVEVKAEGVKVIEAGFDVPMDIGSGKYVNLKRMD